MMKLWQLIVKEVMGDLAQQIKTSTKLTENRLCDKPTTNTPSGTRTISINNNAVLCKRCRLCKRDVAISAYSKNSLYCPDCENALGEMIIWWNNSADRVWWVKSNAKKDRE